MLKLVFADSTEQELHWKVSYKLALTQARKNPNIMQIVQINAAPRVLWDRATRPF